MICWISHEFVVLLVSVTNDHMQNHSLGCSLQGTEDQVVPPNQATDMYEALKKQGLTTALVMFEGEQHGFRQATNIRRALDGEFFFYGKALGFNAKMPDDLEPITVVNLEG